MGCRVWGTGGSSHGNGQSKPAEACALIVPLRMSRLREIRSAPTDLAPLGSLSRGPQDDCDDSSNSSHSNGSGNDPAEAGTTNALPGSR
jgi:hypothetical protein